MRLMLEKFRASNLGVAAMWNALGSGLPLLIGLVTVPVLLSHLGNESFALLTLLWTAIGYFGIFDFGFGKSLTHSIARCRALKEVVGTALIFTGLLSVFLIGAIGALLVFFGVKPLCSEWLTISPALISDATRAFYLAALAIPLVTLSSGLRGILEGFEDFRSAGILRMNLGILNFVLPTLLVYIGIYRLDALVLGLIAARMLNIFQSLWYLRLHALTKEKSWFNLKLVSHLLRFGSWVSLSNVIGPLMVNLDRYLIGGLISTSLLSFYVVPQDFVIRFLFIPMALVTALFPRMTHLFAHGESVEGDVLYKKAFVGLAVIMGALVLGSVILAFPLLSVWIDAEFAKRAYRLLIILLVGLWFNSLALIPLTAIQAKGGVKTIGLIHSLELIIYIPLLYFMMNNYGLIGAALVWSFRTVVDLLLLHIAYKYFHQIKKSN